MEISVCLYMCVGVKINSEWLGLAAGSLFRKGVSQLWILNPGGDLSQAHTHRQTHRDTHTNTYTYAYTYTYK